MHPLLPQCPTLSLPPAHSREQRTPASSLCPQSARPHGSAGQLHRDASLPRHATSSSHTGPEPGPKAAPAGAPTAWPQPSWRHTTSASARSQESSHTVPQEPACQSSTRPEQRSSPPRTRKAPSSGKAGVVTAGQDWAEEWTEGLTEWVPGQLWVDKQSRVSPESCVVFSDNPTGLNSSRPSVNALTASEWSLWGPGDPQGQRQTLQ